MTHSHPLQAEGSKTEGCGQERDVGCLIPQICIMFSFIILLTLFLYTATMGICGNYSIILGIQGKQIVKAASTHEMRKTERSGGGQVELTCEKARVCQKVNKFHAGFA